MTRSHPSRSGDSSRSKRPDRFPEPNVPGGYGGPQGYSTYTPNQQPKQQPPSGYGYPQPPPHPYQLPVPQTNPVGGHAGAISRVHGPQPKTGHVNVNDRARPSPASPPAFPYAFPNDRTPDRAPPPSYPFGAPGVSEPPHSPLQSSPPYEAASFHASGALGPILPQPETGYINDYTLSPPFAFPHPFPNSDTRAPDWTHPPSYPVSDFSTPGRSGVLEPSYSPVPSYGGSLSPSYGEQPPYGAVLSGSRSQVPDHNISPNNHASRNQPSRPSHTPAQSQPLCDTSREYQTHRPYPQAIKPYYPRVGQKKAVIVGINYSTNPDHRFRLGWAADDARVMARFLHESFDFEWSNMRILTDDKPGSLPTKANIWAAMHWLVKGAQPDDTLFFYFSGHATQVKDTNGDEPDGYDECICALDYTGDRQFPTSPTTPGIIVDDDINRIMVQPLPRGCRLTAVLDCCHSGTLLDLPFIYDSHGKLKPSDNPSTVKQKSSPAEVVSLSACKDSENAYEVPAEGGALCRAFIKYMASSGNSGTCLEIIQNLHAYMNAKGVRQRPQLSSSHLIDINQRFTIV